MQNLRVLLLTIPTLTGTLHTTAQQGHTCLAHELTERYLAEQGLSLDTRPVLGDASMTLRGGEPVIPVVVHVVWNTSAENIPDATIHAFMDQLDEDFNLMNANASTVRSTFTGVIADVGIRFCLAETGPSGDPTTGITRTQTTATWFDPNNQPHAMKSSPLGISAWDPTRYFNIWVCDINGTSSNIVNGYSYLPIGGMAGSWQDGIVIDYLHGTPLSARTTTHEAGHYLGIRHPFDGFSCSPGDGFSDTPATNSATWSCGNTNLMKCNVLTQYENFMDYASCAAMFTTQQANYMNMVLNGTRASLLNSNACSLSTGWQEERGPSPLLIFPNPTSDGLITISLADGGTGLVEVVDAIGRTVRAGSIVQGSFLAMDMSDRPAGCYFVHLFTAQGRASVPLMIVR